MEKIINVIIVLFLVMSVVGSVGCVDPKPGCSKNALSIVVQGTGEGKCREPYCRAEERRRSRRPGA